MVNAYLVNHTHWDREWYFTTQDAQVLSDQLFTQVLDELETHPEVNFTLDGQMSIIDEYVEIHPEAKERIHDLVERNQLYIGPWYTQTDALIPSAESLLRNLIIGINDARKNYGKAMMLGYLPDTFGFNANLPMILNQVGIHDFLSWRGTNFDRQAGSVYFKWKALGNAVVFAANFPLGYYTGQIDLESKKNLKDFVENRLDKGIEFEAKHGDNEEVLIPSGIDQMNVVHDLSKTIEDINSLSKNHIEISTYPKFMSLLRNKKLNSYQGELRYPTYSRVHRTISSVRSKNKRKNFELEQKVVRRVEPLMVLAKKVGIPISNGLIIKLWKQIFELQPHDTLGGSVTDNVAVDIEHRFKQANEIADGLENYIKKRLAQRLCLTDHDVIVFNTDMNGFSGYKEITVLTRTKDIAFDNHKEATIIGEEYTPARSHIMQLTENGYEFKDEPAYYKLRILVKVKLAGIGYKVLHFQEVDHEIKDLSLKDTHQISNEYMSLIYKDGKFDFKSGDKEYKNVISIHDSGNDGDTYDYSPLPKDKELKLSWNGKIKVETSQDYQKLILKGTWNLPVDLKNRIVDNPITEEVPYVLELSLTKESKVLSGKLQINNNVLSHRLRVEIKTGLDTNSVTAQIQGGFRETENISISKDWNNEFVEKPVNIYIFDRIVGLHDKEYGLYFIGKGQKEYEKVNGSLFITLMATTGQLGKPDLLWRPGRASGDTTSVGHLMMPTPMAEELGNNTFEFGLTAFDGAFDETKISQRMTKWLSPSISYQMQKYNLFVNRLDNKLWDIEFDKDLPKISKSESYLSISTDCEVSGLYLAYTIKNAIVLRLSNLSGKKVDVKELKEKGFLPANALEEIKEDGQYCVNAYDMATFIKMM